MRKKKNIPAIKYTLRETHYEQTHYPRGKPLAVPPGENPPPTARGKPLTVRQGKTPHGVLTFVTARGKPLTVV
jgi:hypothetical protein